MSESADVRFVLVYNMVLTNYELGNIKELISVRKSLRKTDKYRHTKDYLLSYLQKTYPLLNIKDQTGFRCYLLEKETSLSNFTKDLLEKCKASETFEYRIDFPGILLDSNEDFDVGKYIKEDNREYYIIIDISHPAADNFTFIPKKCQLCNAVSAFFYCKCDTRCYCSSKCENADAKHQCQLKEKPKEAPIVKPDPGLEIVPSYPAKMKNNGNTCYQNSALQALRACLLHSGTFKTFMQICRSGNDVLRELGNVLYNNKEADPIKFQGLFHKALTHGRYDVRENAINRQEDSHEFLMDLIDYINEKSPEGKKEIGSLFQWNDAQIIRCTKCKKTSESTMPSNCMSLPLGPEKKNNFNPVKLQECMDNHYTNEFLTGDNKYFCEGCNEKRDANKETKVSGQGPKILIVQVKRFEITDPRKMRFEKRLDGLEFPNDNFDLRRYIHNPTKSNPYTLFGVIYHQGYNADSGHYMAGCKYGPTWYCCSDMYVHNISTPQSVTDEIYPYILFYRSKE